MAFAEDAATAPWGAVLKRIETAVAKKDFATLESIAEDLRLKKARTDGGWWRLSDFYDALEGRLTTRRKPGDWNACFDFLDQWQRELPGSITQPVIAAIAWTRYAWHARGGGFADTVTEEGWRLMRERLEKARAALEAAVKLPDRCIHWYAAMQTVALGQGWSQAEAMRLLEEGIGREPAYYELYTKHAYYLLPRWHGAPGDWERFAGEIQRQAAGTEGSVIYARIVWAQSGWYQNIFQETAVDWGKTKQGFEDLVKRWPSSRNLNSFVQFAVMAGDQETARSLFARIGDKVDLSVWGSPGRFETVRRSVGVPGARPAQERATLNAPGRPSRAQAVAFSPDGRQLVAGYANGSLVAWDLAKQEPAWTLAAFKAGVSSITFSPDGKLLAAASGIAEKNSVGQGRLWELPSRRERLALADFKGCVSTARFSPDGTKLLFAGGPFNTKADLRLVEVASGTQEAIRQIENHTHAIAAASFSPDGQRLLLDCVKSFNIFDLHTRKVVHSSKGSSLGWVTSAEYSPDGRMFALGYYTEYMGKGGFGLFDVEGYRARKVTTRPEMLGVLTVAFTPDSQAVVAAGYDQVIYVWDTASGRELASLYGHTSMIYKLAISPDGKTIASASFDGTVRLWDMPQTSPR